MCTEWRKFEATCRHMQAIARISFSCGTLRACPLYHFCVYCREAGLFQIILPHKHRCTCTAGASRLSCCLTPVAAACAACEPTIAALGHVYRKLRMFREAAACFDTALSILPGQASTFAGLAYTYHLEVPRQLTLRHKFVQTALFNYLFNRAQIQGLHLQWISRYRSPVF